MLVLVLVLVLAGIAGAVGADLLQEPAVIHIDPLRGPVRSLAAARDAVRRVDRERVGGATVILHQVG
eukprot:SAG31_NODE_2393_length_5793_cov_18.326484_7_plen_67_part_00